MEKAVPMSRPPWFDTGVWRNGTARTSKVQYTRLSPDTHVTTLASWHQSKEALDGRERGSTT